MDDTTFDPILALQRSDTLTSQTSLSLKPPLPSLNTKLTLSKPLTAYSRIDLESLYTDLRYLLGANWDTYYATIQSFTRGTLHAREAAYILDPLLFASDHISSLHNKFILAIALNSARETPEPGVAAFVTSTSDKRERDGGVKVGVGDKSEERLKREVMGLAGRDRRRIKGGGVVADGDEGAAGAVNPYEEAYAVRKVHVPRAENEGANGTAGAVNGMAPPAAGVGVIRTNIEPEIRKRYHQPLLVESGEFPDVNTIFSRMNPICYEEAVGGGGNQRAAELVGVGAEVFFKEMLASIFERVRLNGLGCANTENEGTGGLGSGMGVEGVFTAKYGRSVAREIDKVKDQSLQRTREDGLLPAEAEMVKLRKAIDVKDLKLALRTGPKQFGTDPLTVFEIENDIDEYDDWNADSVSRTGGDAMDVDVEEANDGYDIDDGFDQAGLDRLLDDCLAGIT